MGSGILVVCEHENGAPKKTAYELLSKARELAGALGGGISAVVVGSGEAANLGEYGATTVYTADGADFASGSTGARVLRWPAIKRPSLLWSSARPVHRRGSVSLPVSVRVWPATVRISRSREARSLPVVRCTPGRRSPRSPSPRRRSVHRTSQLVPGCSAQWRYSDGEPAPGLPLRGRLGGEGGRR